ncbi:PAS domain-containing protein [Parvibaculum sp.]|uniref:PAS domain-containing protein n=1 Tax=Parvibaculum sp. TaxID=2024848 RepID=UPI003296A98B
MTNGQGRGSGETRPTWVQPLMEWSAVENVRARLAGPIGHVPDEIGGIALSNAGRQLLGWWLEARGTRPMPDAGDVSPRALVELLPYIRYLSWEDDEKLVIRIYGSALVEASGLDLTGHDIFGHKHDDVENDRERVRQLHRQPCGLVMLRNIYDGAGNPHPCEFMTLPVAPVAGGKARIIGTVVPMVKMREWNVDVVFDRILALQRAVFFDTGAGIPDPSLGLEV